MKYCVCMTTTNTCTNIPAPNDTPAQQGADTLIHIVHDDQRGAEHPGLAWCEAKRLEMSMSTTYKITARVTRYDEDREAEVTVQIDDREPGSCLLLWEAQNDRWVWHGDGLDCWADDDIQSWVLRLPSDFYGAGCDALKSACLSALDRHEAGEDIELGDVVETLHVERQIQKMTFYATIDEDVYEMSNALDNLDLPDGTKHYNYRAPR